jgi:uncharacterized protein YdhG (YjbR/CyaY superfamily)
MNTYTTISAYIAAEPKEPKEAKEIKAKLIEMRALCKKLIPKGEEVIRYGMPTIRLGDTNLIHFASMKGHFGFYPAPSGVLAYEAELKKLAPQGVSYAKGCIRFPYDRPLPIALITKIIKFRVKEVLAEEGKKKVSQKTKSEPKSKSVTKSATKSATKPAVKQGIKAKPKSKK